MLDIVKYCITSNGRLNPHSSKREWWDNHNLTSQAEELFGITSHLPDNANIAERLFCYKHGIKTQPICTVCSKSLKWDKYEAKYPKYCGSKCFLASDEGKDFLIKTRAPKKHVLSDKAVIELHERHHKERKTLKQLSSDVGFCVGYVKKRFEELGLKKSIYRSDKLIPVNKIQEIVNCIESGLDPYQTADKTGISVNYIFKKVINVGLIAYNKKTGSFAEKEIVEYIRSITTAKVLIHDRKLIYPYELDIYIPESKFAIEYCGLYWHRNHDRNYHLNKLEMCLKKDVNLITVFENEWLSKRDIIKSMISSRLGINNKIGARKCTVINLSSHEFNVFMDSNHISGSVPSSVRLGLTLNNELVSVMGFSMSRFTKDCEWEITRFCNKLGTNVIGAASKLFKEFVNIKKPKSVVSYADRRYGTGAVYKHLGFNYSHASKPNYYYFKSGKRTVLKSRIQFQKHKLKQKLDKFDPNKSEYENMFNNGWYRIFDCGNLVYKYTQ